MILTYRYRVKSLSGLLSRQARAVNFVWNYCNDRQKDALRFRRPWLTGVALAYLTAGSGKELGLPSHTINLIGFQYARSRQQHKRPFLRYRGRRALGWVPIYGRDLKREGDAFRFAGSTFRVFNSRPLPAGKIKDGSNFAQDRRGNWFLNIVVEVAGADEARTTDRGVGIDLGLKEFAALSTGEKIANPRHFRKLEDRLASAQRARKKRLATHMHARGANARRDFLHKLSTRIVREFDYIAAGNVNAAGLAKTKMAKSVLDAAWSSFRMMLAYKSIANGARYEEVDESFSSQICSSCGGLPPERPKGIAGLAIRQWVCSDCGAPHDRDVNAAMNLLARSGHRAPVEGIRGLVGGRREDAKRCLPTSSMAPGDAKRVLHPAEPTETSHINGGAGGCQYAIGDERHRGMPKNR